MKIWIDAQLPPALAGWINAHFDLNVQPVRDLGLRDATDEEIFQAARKENAIVMTKDGDFFLLLDQYGPPPAILWITCGNTANARLKEVLADKLPQALALLAGGEPLVEISDRT